MTGADSAKPKDLMAFLVEHRVFPKDHREGVSASLKRRQFGWQ